MRKLVECVPNFSEGRREEVIDEIVKAITSVSGVTLLDREMNADHNRAVISFIGSPEACLEAAFRGAKRASELIDLNKHKGEHPRIGATDVIPFVPISDITMEECVEFANKLGKRIAEELKIPVYLYEAAAKRPERQDLAYIRKGEYEGLKEEIKTNPNRHPDYGEPELHPTAGATVVGARFPLIAYNVNLNTQDIGIAKKIARAIRFKTGGFRYVKALGFEIKEKKCVQVSMNMTNYLGTPLYQAFEFIRREAEKYGVLIKESEIVGLTPQKALIDTAKYYLQLHEFKDDQILENRLKPPKSLSDFISELSSNQPVPGGGSGSALSGGLGCSLGLMVCGLTIGKKGYEDVKVEMKEVEKRLLSQRDRFLQLMDEDSKAFEEVMKAYRLPKETEEDKAKRREAIQKELIRAADVPLEVAKRTEDSLRDIKIVAEKGNKNSISDAGVAGLFLKTAAEGARLNVLINLSGIKDEDYKNRTSAELKEVMDKVREISQEIEKIVERRMGDG